MPEPLRREDVEIDLAAYALRRRDEVARIIELKKRRRVPLGDILTVVFENRDTLRHQVQEMVYVERISSPEAVDEELETYNPLLPTADELSATLFIEIPDMATLTAELPRLVGVEHALSLVVGGDVVKGAGEGGRSREDYTSSVHYVRFPFSLEQRAAFLDRAVPAELVVEHPNYAESARLSDQVRQSLIGDLLA
jgi:hypothetical protein